MFSAATFILSSPATNQIWICGGYTQADISNPTNEVYYTDDGVHWSKWTTGKVDWKARTNPLFQQVGNSLWLSGGTDGDATPFGQEAPWTGIGSGVPGTSAVFNDLMWCMGTNDQFGGNLGIWYFLPDR